MMPKPLPPKQSADRAYCRSGRGQGLVAGDFGDHAVIILKRRCFLASPSVIECTENQNSLGAEGGWFETNRLGDAFNDGG